MYIKGVFVCIKHSLLTAGLKQSRPSPAEHWETVPFLHWAHCPISCDNTCTLSGRPLPTDMVEGGGVSQRGEVKHDTGKQK